MVGLIRERLKESLDFTDNEKIRMNKLLNQQPPKFGIVLQLMTEKIIDAIEANNDRIEWQLEHGEITINTKGK